MGWTRRGGTLLFILATIFANHALSAPQAFAYVCNDYEEATFVAAYDSAGHLTTSVAANQTDILARDSTMDLSCPPSERHSSAIVLSADRGRYAETIEKAYPLPGFNVGHVVQWEYGNVGEPNPPHGVTNIGCCVWMSLRVANVAGTTNWRFLFDWNRTGNFTYLGPTGGGNLGSTRGVPFGETGRRPNNDATDAYDHHVSLKYAVTNAGSSWQSWPGNGDYLGFGGPYGRLSTYHWQYFAPDNYLIRHN
jgi:hypothetical protein